MRYDTKRLEWVKSYKYLGLHFCSDTGFELNHIHAGVRAKGALGLLKGMLKAHEQLGASIDLRQRLYDTLVLPGGDYGCLVWSLPLLPTMPDPDTGFPVAKNNGPERAQRAFLRRLLSASPSTSLDMLYREARRRPWASRWAAAVVRFWNQAVDAPDAPTHLTRHVLTANIKLWLERHRADCWTAQFAAFLCSVQPPDDGGAEAVDETLSAKTGIAPWIWADLGDPRAVDTLHRHRASYHAWFWLEDEMLQGRRSYLHQPAVTRADCRRVASFRLGHHFLGINSFNTAFGERT